LKLLHRAEFHKANSCCSPLFFFDVCQLRYPARAEELANRVVFRWRNLISVASESRGNRRGYTSSGAPLSHNTPTGRYSGADSRHHEKPLHAWVRMLQSSYCVPCATSRRAIEHNALHTPYLRELILEAPRVFSF